VDTKKRIKLDVFRQTIYLRCTSPDELYMLAREVDRRMAEFADQNDRISVTELAILAALSLAQETIAAKKAVSDLEHQIGALEQQLARLKTNGGTHPNY